MELYKLTYKTPVKGKIKTVEAVKKAHPFLKEPRAEYYEPEVAKEGYRTITGKWFYEGDFIKAETITA